MSLSIKSHIKKIGAKRMFPREEYFVRWGSMQPSGMCQHCCSPPTPPQPRPCHCEGEKCYSKCPSFHSTGCRALHRFAQKFKSRIFTCISNSSKMFGCSSKNKSEFSQDETKCCLIWDILVRRGLYPMHTDIKVKQTAHALSFLPQLWNTFRLKELV